MLKDKSNITSVLFCDENSGGKLQLIVNENFQDNSKYGIIENVFVDPEYRNNGIATSLVEEAIKYAKENSLYKVVLNCSDKNVDLYHRNGFKIHQYNMRHFLK